MKWKIENLAKIHEADINIDGITVIAGDNNTGKCAVGKVFQGWNIFCCVTIYLKTHMYTHRIILKNIL